jgi:hypothetical protein
MVSACYANNYGFYVFNLDTRTIINGYSHEIAPGHTPKHANTLSSIHGSGNIITDHNDSDSKLFLCDHNVNTGGYTKFFISSNNRLNDLNYIENTSLVIAAHY